eukprot:2726162-Alexandrium_andersonii.AAC.1
MELQPLEGGGGDGQPSVGGDGLEDAPDGPASAGGVVEHPSAEGQEPRVARDPAAPSDEKRQRHQCTQVPFRSWCQHCARGGMPNLPRS